MRVLARPGLPAGSCSCRWRGTHTYPIGWIQFENQAVWRATSGLHSDWAQHTDEVMARSIPLPAGLEDLLDQVDNQLSALAADELLAALKAVAAPRLLALACVPVSLRCIGGRYRTPADGNTLSGREGRRDRAKSRRAGRRARFPSRALSIQIR